jgi:hypothetical protein
MQFSMVPRDSSTKGAGLRIGSTSAGRRALLGGIGMLGAIMMGAVAAAAAGLQVRTNYQALVLHYNPHVQRNANYLTIREAYDYRDIDILCADYIKFLKRASWVRCDRRWPAGSSS